MILGNNARGLPATTARSTTSPARAKFELRLPLVSTVNNYADFFTKPLKSKAFFGLRNKIMNIA